MRKALKTYLFLATLSIFAASQASMPDDDEFETRLNPDFGTAEAVGESDADFSRYPFLNLEANRIELNGADWLELRRKFEESLTPMHTFTMVHIGDSHIQAEGSTSVLRRLMQQMKGDAGRGLITPLKAAGTNQPADYSLTFSCPVASSKLLHRPWLTQMGFTGTTVSPRSRSFDMTVSAHDAFKGLRLIASGSPLKVTGATVGGRTMAFKISRGADGTTVMLGERTDKVCLSMQSDGASYIAGVCLQNGPDDHGVVCHAIGNNGAAFSSYNGLNALGAGVACLHPNLVIISLGTNEAFGTFNLIALYQDFLSLVNDIKYHNPGSVLLLTTPMECQRRSGRRGRAANTNIARVRELMLRFCREQHIASWDLYDVASGQGASSRWWAAGLMARDRIHCTWDGYALRGRLLFDALAKALG